VSFKNIIRKSVFPVLLLVSYQLQAQVNFSFHSSWTWLRGSESSSLPSGWKDKSYDDSSWHTGAAPFRYGDGTGGTELSDMMNGYTTLYLRSTFSAANTSLLNTLTLNSDYDDGFIIWINGVEAIRINAPASPAYNSLATANHESGTAEKFLINAGALNLNEGTNVIAVQAFNVSLTSSDFYFDIHLGGEPDVPEFRDTIGVAASVSSGFFGNPFYVTLTSPYPSTGIVYTLDGSNPQSSANSFFADSPASVLIDPQSTAGRGTTPAVTLRASVTETGFKPGKPVSYTYIFTEKVKKQGYPGGGWPSSDVNGQSIDLAMDPKIVDNPAYSAQMQQSLLDIPSISIVTDLSNLFDPAEGIYVNAEGHGLNWEKECSVELITNDGSPGFKTNAGLRIRGGWSRHGDFPKHALRLFFRTDYGAGKLHYPLFGDEGASEFDKVDLRCEENYAWSNGSSNNSLVREVFSRDSQRDMGEPYTRSRYYHLYIDGMYWGIYQTQERSEADFAETYFGGKNEDYDVVKVNTENYYYNIEATDGNLSKWQEVWNMCLRGFTSNSNYFAIEGKDKDGKPIKGSEVLVDIDNLIDYMLVIFYTGNFDAPTSSFGGNKGCNNYYAIKDRTDRSKGFVFFAHDSEHAMFDEAHPPGAGIDEDRVNLTTRTDGMNMTVSDFYHFHPQWLHSKLSENAEYRNRFSDRAYNAFRPGGVLSESAALERLNKRIAEINLAVIAESARWGDAKTGGSWAFTRNDSWIPEINKIRNYFIPYRGNRVINQLKIAGLYSTVMAPQFFVSAVRITKPFTLNSAVELKIRNLNSTGTIYYTFDGADPRATGGNALESAKSGSSDIILKISKTTTVKARVLSNGIWSALEEVCFINPSEDFSKLKVTEISYHPKDYINGSDTIQSKDLEFLEMKNTGRNSVNLSGVRIDTAINYTFPDGSVLPPGRFYVVASKPKKFYEYYGMIASGNFSGNLSNDGEEILIGDSSGNKLIDFTYSVFSPWPAKANGDGFTLSAAFSNPLGDPADYKYWIQSAVPGGTPFADNNESNPGQTASDQDIYITAYPNPTSGPLTLTLISPDEPEVMNVQIISVTGKVLYTATIPNPGMIDMAAINLPAGIYFIKSDKLPLKSAQRIVLLKQ
jgi:hypothetical protein